MYEIEPWIMNEQKNMFRKMRSGSYFSWHKRDCLNNIQRIHHFLFKHFRENKFLQKVEKVDIAEILA